MADLAKLFKQAEKKLTNTGLRQEKTQEVLELRVPFEQGIAWRTLPDGNVLQIYPTCKKESSKSSCDSDYFVLIKRIKDPNARYHNAEYRYYDPDCKLISDKWSYIGCKDCSNLSDDVVLGWIKQAYEYLMRDKG